MFEESAPWGSTNRMIEHNKLLTKNQLEYNKALIAEHLRSTQSDIIENMYNDDYEISKQYEKIIRYVLSQGME